MSDKGKFHPVIDYKICGKCNYRSCSCPNGAFVYDNPPRYDKDLPGFQHTISAWKCTGCGECLKQCRHGAIKILSIEWVSAIMSDHFHGSTEKI